MKSITYVPDSTKLSFHFSGMIAYHLQSGMRQEKRNAPDSPDLSRLSQRIGDISWQHLGLSGNSKIPDRLGFSQHMKTRLKDNESNNSVLESLWQSGKFCLLLNFVALGNLQLLVSSPCTHLGAENSK